MIDKFFYWLFGLADSFGHWMEDYFNLHNKKCKCRVCKKKRKKPSNEDLFNGE